ncbi:MAG: DUF2442 domain-containing protein [Planctomycetaceae bacterium]|nr:DUF2442 domain-containing protein [Planctomycetaceae bacterium]
MWNCGNPSGSMFGSYRERRSSFMTTSNSSSKNGPNTLADRALKAWHDGGIIFVRFASGHEVRFPIKGNPRLESAEEADLGCIEISPFGLHWPKLDEDLSLAGILDGRYGQHQPAGNR